MGLESPLQKRQNEAYWTAMGSAKKLRKILKAVDDGPFYFEESRERKKRLDDQINGYRKEILELREATYDVRLNGESDCKSFAQRSSWIDHSEIFPNWFSKYRGANYRFGQLASNGETIIPAEGNDYLGFWQLFRNLLSPEDDRLELWPRYFGESSTGKSVLKNQSEILDEIRFPLSGANLEGAIAVDLETTSLSPMDGEIIEIGIVEIRGKDPLEWPRFSLRFGLSSDRARSLGTGAFHIHGIALEDIGDRPTIADREVQRLLREYLCSGRRLLMHNAPFEFKWLTQYVDGFFEANTDAMGLQSVIDTALICKFSFQLNGGMGVKNNKLQSVVEELGYGYEGGHRAQADAAMAALAAHGMLRSVAHTDLRALNGDSYSKVLSNSHSAPTL